MQRELTKGSILGNIATFSLPYLLSYFLQTMYGLADLFIIGQFGGAEITSAVSIGSQVMHMFTVIIVGLAMGSTVLIGRAVGSRNQHDVSETIGNTAALFALFAAVATAALLLLCRGVVSLMHTPPEAFDQTRIYLMICFAGIPFITAYNIISAMLRGMGDTKSPMVFVAVACVINIALDYVFIGVFGMLAAGAALGTVLAQACSVAFALVYLKKKGFSKEVNLTGIRPQRAKMLEMLKIGVPVAVQDGFIQVSFLVITMIANSRGVQIAAAVGIVEKVIGIIFLVPSTMLSTVSALAAQNMGAGQHERARATLRAACGIVIGFGVAVSIITQFAASWMVGLFTSDPEVVEWGRQYLITYVWDCIPAGVHFSFSGFFCAYGLSIVSFIHNSISIITTRIPGAYLASKFFPHSLSPMGMAAPLGSLLSAVICFGVYLYMNKKKWQK